MKLRHKWHKDTCINCGVSREITNTKARIAIVNGKDVFKYERKFNYFTLNGSTTERPQCYTKRYDD